MENKRAHKINTKDKKSKASNKDAIAELKKKIKHQKEALNKIIETYSKSL